MTAVDTSVVVAGFASWHEAHAVARAALKRRPRISAHALVESFSVLTRLPPPHRAPSTLVTEFLQQRFPGPALALPARRLVALLQLATKAGIRGGAIYDALVGATAKHAGATLLTRDRRAIRAYELVGATYEVVD